MQHQQEDEPVSDRINDLEEGHQVDLMDRLGQGCRRQKPMATAQNRLLRDQSLFTQKLEEFNQQAELGVDRSGRETGLLSGADEIGNVL